MDIKQHNNQISCSAQINPEDVSTLAEQGFKLIINNRPDGEAEGQPSNAEIAAAAEAAGLDYAYIPIQRELPQDSIDTLKELLANAKGPVLAYCRTGTRSTNLWIMTLNAENRVPAMEHARTLGYDLSLSSKALNT
mgnify:CR=1 FL=1